MLVAHIILTALTALSAGVAVVAGRSAFHKWRSWVTDSAKVAALRATSIELQQWYQDQMSESVNEDGRVTVDMADLQARYDRKKAEAGIPSKSLGAWETDQVVSPAAPVPPEGRAEIIWGLVAVVVATVASIWGIWI